MLFPTGQTVKYKIGDNEFSAKVSGTNYENKDLQAEDKVILIPFQQSKNTKSGRKFGYAVVSPAKDTNNSEIPNSWKLSADGWMKKGA